MKNYLCPTLLIAAACLSPFTATASEESYDWYLVAGLGIGSGEEEGDSDYVYYNYTADFDSFGVRFGGGYIFNDLIRAEVTYTQEEMDFEGGDISETFSSLDFDAIWTFTEYPVRPYLLAGLGLTTYHDTEEYLADDEGDLNGVSIQLAAGGIWRVTPQFELDAGLKIRGIGWQELESSGGGADLQVSTGITQFSFNGRVLF